MSSEWDKPAICGINVFETSVIEETPEKDWPLQEERSPEFPIVETEPASRSEELFEDGQREGHFLNQNSTSFEMEKEDEDDGNDLELDLVGSFLSDVCGIASTPDNLTSSDKTIDAGVPVPSDPTYMNFLRQINNIPSLPPASVNDHQPEIEYSETCPADAPITANALITSNAPITAEALVTAGAPVILPPLPMMTRGNTFAVFAKNGLSEEIIYYGIFVNIQMKSRMCVITMAAIKVSERRGNWSIT